MHKTSFKQSLKSPVFWLFKISIFIGSFSVTQMAFAGYKFWGNHVITGAATTPVSSPSDAFTSMFTGYWVPPAISWCGHSTYCNYWTPFGTKGLNRVFSCDEGDTANHTVEQKRVSHQEFADAVTTDIGAGMVQDGCQFVPDYDAEDMVDCFTEDVAGSVAEETQVSGYCKIKMVSTGATAQSTPDTPQPVIPSTSVKSNRSDTTTVTPVPTETITNDGVTTETDQTVTVEAVGEGTSITTEDNVIVTSMGGGIIKTTTETTKTTTMPDGSKTEVTTTEVEYSQSDQTRNTITVSPESKTVVGSVNVIEGFSAGKETTTVTKEFDTNGTLHVESTTTTTTGGTGGSSGGSSGGTSGGSSLGSTTTESPDLCTAQPNAPSCGVAEQGNFNGPSDGLYDPIDRTYADVFGDFQAQVESANFYQQSVGFFDVDINGGACPAWSVGSLDVMGFDLGGFSFDYHCQPAFLGVLQSAGAVIILMAGFFGFRIAFDN